MTQRPSGERLVVAHIAGTSAEAMVIRGLLQSAGILSPDFDSADPFPLNEPPEGAHGAEIYVPESQVEDARRILAEFSKGHEGSMLE
jgi:hypothetical protein